MGNCCSAAITTARRGSKDDTALDTFEDHPDVVMVLVHVGSKGSSYVGRKEGQSINNELWSAAVFLPGEFDKFLKHFGGENTATAAQQERSVAYAKIGINSTNSAMVRGNSSSSLGSSEGRGPIKMKVALLGPDYRRPLVKGDNMVEVPVFLPNQTLDAHVLKKETITASSGGGSSLGSGSASMKSGGRKFPAVMEVDVLRQLKPKPAESRIEFATFNPFDLNWENSRFFAARHYKEKKTKLCRRLTEELHQGPKNRNRYVYIPWSEKEQQEEEQIQEKRRADEAIDARNKTENNQDSLLHEGGGVMGMRKNRQSYMERRSSYALSGAQAAEQAAVLATGSNSMKHLSLGTQQRMNSTLGRSGSKTLMSGEQPDHTNGDSEKLVKRHSKNINVERKQSDRDPTLFVGVGGVLHRRPSKEGLHSLQNDSGASSSSSEMGTSQIMASGSRRSSGVGGFMRGILQKKESEIDKQIGPFTLQERMALAKEGTHTSPSGSPSNNNNRLVQSALQQGLHNSSNNRGINSGIFGSRGILLSRKKSITSEISLDDRIDDYEFDEVEHARIREERKQRVKSRNSIRQMINEMETEYMRAKESEFLQSVSQGVSCFEGRHTKSPESTSISQSTSIPILAGITPITRKYHPSWCPNSRDLPETLHEKQNASIILLEPYESPDVSIDMSINSDMTIDSNMSDVKRTFQREKIVSCHCEEILSFHREGQHLAHPSGTCSDEDILDIPSEKEGFLPSIPSDLQGNAALSSKEAKEGGSLTSGKEAGLASSNIIEAFSLKKESTYSSDEEGTSYIGNRKHQSSKEGLHHKEDGDDSGAQHSKISPEVAYKDINLADKDRDLNVDLTNKDIDLPEKGGSNGKPDDENVDGPSKMDSKTDSIGKKDRSVTVSLAAKSMSKDNPAQASKEKLTNTIEEIPIDPTEIPCEMLNVDQSEVYVWRIGMRGPENSAYADGIFLLKFSFNASYPTHPPNVEFLTPVFHPNVNPFTGVICPMDLILREQWSSSITIEKLLDGISNLLKNPNVDGQIKQDAGGTKRKTSFVRNTPGASLLDEPKTEEKPTEKQHSSTYILNTYAAVVFKLNRIEYHKIAREWTKKHSCIAKREKASSVLEERASANSDLIEKSYADYGQVSVDVTAASRWLSVKRQSLAFVRQAGEDMSY